MKKLLILALMLSGTLWGQTPSGLGFNPLQSSYSSTDVHVPTGYQTTVSPAVGAVQSDPDFGTQFWKVADNSVHEYSAMSVIDTADRWIVTIPTNSGGVTTPAVIRNLLTGASVCSVTGVGQNLRWGINDPDILWYANSSDNKIYLYSVTAHTSALGTFAACSMNVWDTQTVAAFSGHAISNCFGESDIANKGGSDMMCLSGSAGDDLSGATARAYNASTKTLFPAITGTSASGSVSHYFGTQCNDYADMTYVNGNVLLDYNGLSLSSGCTTHDVAPFNFGGVDVFNGTDGKYIRTVQTWGCGHGSRAMDSDGSEIIVCNNNFFDPAPPSGGGSTCDNAIIKTRIADSGETCLLNYAHNLPSFPPGTPDVRREQLTSVHNVTGAGYKLMVTYVDNAGESGTPTPPLCTAYRGPLNDTTLPSDCASTWGVVMNELTVLPLDPPANAMHLVHHHSFWVGSGGVQYWSAVHGSISRSQRYVAFDSAFLNTWPNMGVFVAHVVTLTGNTVTPNTVTMPILGTQQFSASSSVAWSVPVGCGSVSPASGTTTFYTAPSTANNCTITGGTATAVATVLALSVSPASVSLNVGATQQFTSNFSSSWSATCGSITSSGLYTSPSTNGTCTITATAVNGHTTATATATISGQVTFIPLSVTPTSWTQTTSISAPITKIFTATNIGTGTVTPAVLLTGPAPFSISGNTCTAPLTGSSNCSVTVRFFSATVGSFSATLQITDTAGGSTTIPISISIPTGTVVTISPKTSTIPVNGVLQFSSSTSNGSTVTYAATCGTFSASTYTAPNAANVCTVTATATDGSGSTDTAIVTVVTIAVNPSAVTMQINSAQQFTANVPVSWSAGCGTMNAISGFYTAPASPASCSIVATANNGGATGTASVTVQNPPAGTTGGKHNGKGNPHKFQ